MTYASSYATLEDFLTIYVDHLDDAVPDSYQYIELYFSNIEPDDVLYPTLQKAVYLDIIANQRMALDGSLLITEDSLAQVMKAHRWQSIPGSSAYVTITDLQDFVDALPDYREYYCGIEEIPNYTIDVSDFALTEVENFTIMKDVYERLTTQYLYRDTFDKRDLIAGAIKGMVDAAQDEYTTYFFPVETEAFQTSLGSEYTGIGVVVEPTEEWLRVVSPFQWSPAKEAGIQPGDVITHVDDVSIAGMGAQAADLIMGSEDTEVQLTLQRNDQQLTFVIVRAIVKITMVTDEMLPNNDYYIALMSFGFGASSDMRDAMERYLNSGAEKLIIDMRHNPGGSVSELEAMLDMFLPPDTQAFSMRGAGYHYTYTTSSSRVSLPSSSEIILLVDGGSASAAEMLALILQDHDKAVVVGETTFGKGTAQSLVDYADGSSFKYTIYERFSTKTNTSINYEGVTPDHIIILDEDRLDNGYDNQLEYAKSL